MVRFAFSCGYDRLAGAGVHGIQPRVRNQLSKELIVCVPGVLGPLTGVGQAGDLPHAVLHARAGRGAGQAIGIVADESQQA